MLFERAYEMGALSHGMTCSAMCCRLPGYPHKRYSKLKQLPRCQPEDAECPSFAPEAMPTTRAITPQSEQRISLSTPVLKPRDRSLIVISKFSFSLSSHVAEPSCVHTGHLTDITKRSRLCTTVSLMQRRRVTNNRQIRRRLTADAVIRE
jgi:hypothetical protein